MIFDSPIPFSEAVKYLAARQLMPTGLDSAGIRDLDASLRRKSLFSAQTRYESLLERYKEILQSIVHPDQVPTEDGQTVTRGYDPASSRLAIKKFLKSIGYQPEEGKAGTIQDLSSDARINLMLDTNTTMANAGGRFVRQNLDEDVVDLWPGLELIRFIDKKEPRDWKQRWLLAAQEVRDLKALHVLGHTGRMCALKSSGVWQALGDGAGGYEDTLGNPFAPFAFNSGMDTEEMSRGECVEVGLIGEKEPAKPAALDLSKLFSAS